MGKQELKQRIKEVIEQSPFREDIQRVSLFGSYAYGVPSEESDIDLLIEFVPTIRLGLFKYAHMQNYFQDQLQKRVDLTTPTAMSKYIRDAVLGRAELVYDK